VLAAQERGTGPGQAGSESTPPATLTVEGEGQQNISLGRGGKSTVPPQR
jgi:hypothetical protein